MANISGAMKEDMAEFSKKRAEVGKSAVQRLVKLPLPGEMPRMESGPVQFGEDDWPGVFLRGDNALGMSNYIEYAAKEMENKDPLMSRALMGLVSDLRSCKAT